MWTVICDFNTKFNFIVVRWRLFCSSACGVKPSFLIGVILCDNREEKCQYKKKKERKRNKNSRLLLKEDRINVGETKFFLAFLLITFDDSTPKLIMAITVIIKTKD
jgi:hypothetical protein